MLQQDISILWTRAQAAATDGPVWVAFFFFTFCRGCFSQTNDLDSLRLFTNTIRFSFRSKITSH